MYFRIIAERCGRELAAVTEKARRDFWLGSDEAKDYGLVSGIITKRTELPFHPASL